MRQYKLLLLIMIFFPYSSLSLQASRPILNKPITPFVWLDRMQKLQDIKDYRANKEIQDVQTGITRTENLINKSLEEMTTGESNKNRDSYYDQFIKEQEGSLQEYKTRLDDLLRGPVEDVSKFSLPDNAEITKITYTKKQCNSPDIPTKCDILPKSTTVVDAKNLKNNQSIKIECNPESCPGKLKVGMKTITDKLIPSRKDGEQIDFANVKTILRSNGEVGYLPIGMPNDLRSTGYEVKPGSSVMFVQ